MVLNQWLRDDTNSFSPPVTCLLFFLSGLNDPAPAAVKDISENNQWSMFEVQRRVSGEGEGGVVIVGGLGTHCHPGEMCGHTYRQGGSCSSGEVWLSPKIWDSCV